MLAWPRVVSGADFKSVAAWRPSCSIQPSERNVTSSSLPVAQQPIPNQHLYNEVQPPMVSCFTFMALHSGIALQSVLVPHSIVSLLYFSALHSIVARHFVKALHSDVAIHNSVALHYVVELHFFQELTCVMALIFKHYIFLCLHCG